MEVELAYKYPSEVGEGPVWNPHNNKLYWVDVTRGQLHSIYPDEGDHRYFSFGQTVGAIAIRESGGLVLAMQQGFAFFNEELEKLVLLLDPEAHISTNRFNDGKCDPAGRFWAGTMAVDGCGNAGALYYLDTDLTVTKAVEHVSISNGLAWSPNGEVMYYIDSGKNVVTAYDYCADDATLTNERVSIESPLHGLFDGLTIDEEGMLWVALFGGGALVRYDPSTGEELERFELPVTQVTSCAFGGTGLNEIYVTSCRLGLSKHELESEELAGSVFRLRTNVRGLAAHTFAG